MNKRMMVVGSVAGLGLLVAGGGLAFAQSGGDDGPGSHRYTQEQADQATRAALEATGGGTANSVETDDENGATYEVEVTRPDGATVDVRLDDNYEVVVIEGDSDQGDAS